MANADAGFTFVFDVIPFHQVKKFVLNRLDLESKKNCRLVCKRWEKGVSDAVYFNLKVTDEETSQVIKKMTKPIKDLTLSFLNFPYPVDGYGFISVQNLTLDCDYGADEVKMCEENLHRILEKCGDIKSLEVLNGVVPDGTDGSFKYILFSNLRRLKICCKADDRFCAEILRRTFPHLTSLCINLKYTPTERDESPYMDLSYTQIFEFISRHGSTLKDIDIYRGDIIEAQNRGMQVQLRELDPDAKNTLIDQLKQVQLSTFAYTYTLSDKVYPLCDEMLKAQTQLMDLTIRSDHVEFGPLV